MKNKITHFVTRSLRNKLLFSLAFIHLLTISGVAWYFYASYGALMETIKDDQLEQWAAAYTSNPQMPQLSISNMRNGDQKGVYIVQIWDNKGNLQVSSRPSLHIALQKTSGFHTLRTGTSRDEQWRVYSRKGDPGSQIGTIQLIHNIGYMQDIVIRRALTAIIPLIMLFPLTFGVLWLVIRRVSRDLKNASILIASQNAYTLSDVQLKQVPDEILPLVEAYNSVLNRLSKAFDMQRHFLQDSAHELRTPITAISLQLENLRQYIAPGEATDRFIQLEAGVIRTRHLVGQLLSLTRQEGSESTQSTVEPINVSQILKQSIEQLMVLADQRGIDIGFSGNENVFIQANYQELRSLFDNLIDNAMWHTPRGTIIDVVLKTDAGSTVVEVIDNGPGIPEEHIHRAFDRFARFNTTETNGSGLGLAIVQNVALRHGLTVELRNLYDGKAIRGFCAKVSFQPNLN